MDLTGPVTDIIDSSNVLKTMVDLDMSVREVVGSIVNHPANRDAIAQSVGRFNSMSAQCVSSKKYRTKYVGNIEGIEHLSRNFPEFDIQVGVSYDSVGHSLMREERQLFEHLVMYVYIGTNLELLDSPISGMRYDVLVKNIGGNVISDKMGAYGNVHICSPVINFADTFRFHNTMHNLAVSACSHMFKSQEARTRQISLLTRNGAYRCNKLSQNCTVTAPFVVSIHSSYDIGYFDLVRILDQSECGQAYFVFHYHPDILIKNKMSGVLGSNQLSWTKFTEDGVKKIRFDFRDGQDAYVHRMDTYLLLLSLRTIRNLSDTYSYCTNIKTFRVNTVVVEIVRDPRLVAPSETLWRTMTLWDGPSPTIVKTWIYKTCNRGKRSDTNMVPSAIFVDTRFWNALLNSARAVLPGKFTVNTIFTSGIALANSRRVNGEGNKRVDITSDEMIVIAEAAWLYVFITTFEAGKARQILKDDINDVRSFNDSNALWKFVAKRLFRYGPKEDLHPIKTAIIENDLNPDKPSSVFTRLRDCILNFLFDTDINYKYPVEIESSGLIMEYSTLIKSSLNYVYQEGYSYFAPLTDDTINFDAAMEAMGNILTSDKSEKEKEPDYPTRECCEDAPNLTVFQVPGDGNCMYHSFIKAMDLPMSTTSLRSAIASSKYCPKHYVKSISLDGNWADYTALETTAKELNVTVCLHLVGVKDEFEETSFFTVNPGYPKVHFQLKENHFSPLVSDIVVDELDIIELSQLQKAETVEAVILGDYNYFIKELMNDTGKVGKDYAVESSICQKYCFTDGFGYQSSYGIILSEAWSVLDLQGSLKVLDINHRNRSSCKFFADVVKTDVTSVRYSNWSEHLCDNAIEVITVQQNKDVSDCLTPLNRQFDVMSVNPSVYHSQISKFEYDSQKRDLEGVKCISFLKAGGSIILPFPICCDEETISCLSKLIHLFEKSYIVKPRFLPTYNPWVVFVGKGFIKDPESDMLEVLSGDKQSSYEDLNVYLTNIYTKFTSELLIAVDQIKNNVDNNGDLRQGMTKKELVRISKEVLNPRKVFAGANSHLEIGKFDVSLANKYKLPITKSFFPIILSMFSKEKTEEWCNRLGTAVGVEFKGVLTELWLSNIHNLLFTDPQKRMHAYLRDTVKENRTTLKFNLDYRDLLRGKTVTERDIATTFGFKFLDELDNLKRNISTHIETTKIVPIVRTLRTTEQAIDWFFKWKNDNDKAKSLDTATENCGLIDANRLVEHADKAIVHRTNVLKSKPTQDLVNNIKTAVVNKTKEEKVEIPEDDQLFGSMSDAHLLIGAYH